MTGVIPFGIWKPIKLIATKNVRVDNYRMESIVSGTNAEISFDVEITGFKPTAQNIKAVISLDDGENQYTCQKDITVNLGDNKFSVST